MEDLDFEYNIKRMFSREQVDKVLNSLSVVVSEDTKKSLELGSKSNVIENIVLDDHTLKDARIQLFPGKNGQPNVKFDFKDIELELPLEVLKKKLSSQQKVDMENGKLILIQHNNIDFLVGFDKENNKITIGFKNDVLLNNGLPKGFSYGGYEFTDQERIALLNGEKLLPKVFFDDKSNQYVLANLSFNQQNDKVFLHLSNPKLITDHEKALNLMVIHNSTRNVQEPKIETDPNKLSPAKSPIPQTELLSDNKFIREIVEAASTQNFDKLKELAKVDPSSLNTVTIQGVLNNQNVSHLKIPEKLAVLHSLNVKEPEKLLVRKSKSTKGKGNNIPQIKKEAEISLKASSFKPKQKSIGL